jgi:hypothetical protein
MYLIGLPPTVLRYGTASHLARYEAEERVAGVMLRRMEFWLHGEGLDMKGFLELGDSYGMKASELMLHVVQGIESTIKLLKKESKFYLCRDKNAYQRYAAH